MKIKLSDRLLHPELSNNFLSSQGKFTTETSYCQYHVKILKNEEIDWLKPWISERLREDVHPFLMTNTGNVFLYLPRNNAVYYYLPMTNTGDFIGYVANDFWEWFFDTFFTGDVFQELFGTNLFHLPVNESEILFAAPFLSDIPENYKAMSIEMAYEFIDAYQD